MCPGQLVVNADSVKGNSVSSASFTLYETDSNGNIIREIESGNLIGNKLTTNLDMEGNYLVKLSRNNFKNGRYYFNVDACELPVSTEKLNLNVKFDCPNNILSGLLTNSTSIISLQQVEIYHGNKIYDFVTDSNGYGYISIENPGTYTFYVSREGYDLLLYDFNVNELCPEPIEPEEEDDESDDENDDENDDEVIVEPEPPFEEIDDAPKSLFDRVLTSLIPQLNIRSGCDGFYNEGIPLILCDLVWLILLVEAVLIGYFQRENKRKYMFVVMPIVPLLIALIILPVVGVLLGSIELGFSLYFYYRKKARDREEYERVKEEL